MFMPVKSAMKLAVSIGLLVAACLLIGCNPAVSMRPLQDPKDKPISEPQIEGQWVAPYFGKADDVRMFWKISPQGDSYAVEVRYRPDEDKSTENLDSYDLFLSRLEDKLFFDAEFVQRTTGANTIRAKDLEVGMVPVHLVGRVWVYPTYLRIAMLDSHWVEEHVPEDARVIHSTAVITASTDALRKLLFQNEDDERAFVYVWYMCRQGIDCSSQVVEDELKHRPDDPEILHSVADFFIARRNYARAATLLRHRCDLQPDDPSSKEDLGIALLFTGDFNGARREFSAAEALDPHLVPAQHIVWSYFLEGKFDEAVKTSTDYLNSGKNFSADPILLAYFSLLRLGRTRQAETLLADQTAKFVGRTQEHLLLLKAQGRVSEPYWTGHDDNEIARFQFFDGLNWIARNQPGEGRASLERAASSAEKASIIAVAARIELDRLLPKTQSRINSH